MIKVLLEKDNDTLKKIIVKGHADYDDLGKDIVCAAVSSIVTTTINATEKFDKKYIKHEYKNDTLTIEIIESNEITTKLFDNMINLLYELHCNYPKNINIL